MLTYVCYACDMHSTYGFFGEIAVLGSLVARGFQAEHLILCN